MKKMIALVLAALMLLCSCALAEPLEEESAKLTKEEMEMYLDEMGKEALQDGNAAVVTFEDGTSYAEYAGGALKISDEELTETTAILGIYPAEDQADLRGLFLGASLDEVLRAYPNDNALLSGTYYDAALYVIGEKPQVAAGFLLRDGQRVTEVVHTVYDWQPDGVEVWMALYTLENGFVTNIYVGSAERMEEEEALESIREIADMQETSEYFAYARSETGEGLAPFTREDLGLLADGHVKLDFLDLTAETMADVFGPAPVDEWTEDSDGAFLRLLQWDGVSLLLQYDAGKQFLSVDSLTINDDVLDGPRGVRVGDPLDSVLYRFLHGEVFVADDSVVLYGDGQEAPYGMLVYSPEGAELSYAFSLDESRGVIWHMTFVAGTLQTMSLLLR